MTDRSFRVIMSRRQAGLVCFTEVKMLDDLIFGVFRLLVSRSPSDLLQITKVTLLVLLSSFLELKKKGHNTLMSCLFSCLHSRFN